jgi:hypothetical protein
MSERKRKMLENSWAHQFSSEIFANIDEMMFAPLYSEKTNSRPNSPINVIFGALILKDFMCLTEDEFVETMEFDFRYQYALHTTSFEQQPISDRTFSRFRERVTAYELVTGIDLIHECMVSLADHICKFMDLNPLIKRMDSMMVESNIKKMGRLELIYTCLSNLVTSLKRGGYLEVIKGLEDYADPNNRNKVVYYEKDIPQSERLQKVIDDAVKLLPLCKETHEETTDYQLLMRAISEQTKDDGNGHIIPKDKGEMDSTILQNPADPDATYRCKAGKEHRGYVANITETVGENGSIITDYQYDVNTRSDASFIKEYVDNQDESPEAVALITDGAYDSHTIKMAAAKKGIAVLSTGLIGKHPKPILSQFEITDEGTVSKCPEGNTPKSSSYIKQSNSTRVSFLREQCENCPHRSECNPELKERVATMTISLNSRKRLMESLEVMDEDVRNKISRIRNGVETSPSILRNKYGVDKMPARGKLKTKHLFGFKIGAQNFAKLMRYVKGKSKCRTLATV